MNTLATPADSAPARNGTTGSGPLLAAHTPNFPELLPGDEVFRALAGLADTAERPEPLGVAFAWEMHQAGRFADAARGYQAVLDRDPDHVPVLHVFGVLHHQ